VYKALLVLEFKELLVSGLKAHRGFKVLPGLDRRAFRASKELLVI
jgi:hypothetical protein